MNPLIQLQKATPPFLGLFVLVYLTLSPRVQAVVPPPDGGYPGGNTAEGQNALFSLTTGGFNTAVGFLSLRNNTTGSENTATGANALQNNINGTQNSAFGVEALFSNTTGGFNTANGTNTLLSNTTGSFNTASGTSSLYSNNTGRFNTANGMNTLYSNTAGTDNTAVGFNTLYRNTTGGFNTANGESALGDNTTGSHNTAMGGAALFSNTTGWRNIALGETAGVNVTTANDVIAIGAGGANVSNSCFIGQIFGVTSLGGAAVFINSNGRLGTSTSSQRFKEEIKPMERASETLFALRPVTFRYRKGIDPQRIPQFGLVAEDVEAVNRDLVVRDKEGKPYSVRYDQVNAMLLNEFLKEHRKNEEQEATIAQLKSGIETLTATVKEQASLIQKVSAQLEASKSAPQVVNNP